MIIEDLFEANASTFISDLEKRIAKIKSTIVGTKEDGDFQETLRAHLSILVAALDGAKIQYEFIIQKDA